METVNNSNQLVFNILPITTFDLGKFLLCHDTATSKVTRCNFSINLNTKIFINMSKIDEIDEICSGFTENQLV